MSSLEKWGAYLGIIGVQQCNSGFINGDYTIIVGGNKTTHEGIIYYSINGGATWQQSLNALDKSYLIAKEGVFQNCFMFEKHAIAANQSSDETTATIYYSSDSGKTWSVSTVPGNLKNVGTFPQTICMFDNCAICVGNDFNGSGYVYNSFDYGKTWITQPFIINKNNVTRLSSCYLVEDNAILVGTGTLSSFVYHSTDNGTTWTHVADISSGTFNSCYMVRDTVLTPIKNITTTYAIAVGSSPYNGIIYYSLDGGLTWESTLSDLSNSSTFLWCSMSGNNAIAVGEDINHNLIIYYSTNNGKSWKPSSGNFANRLDFFTGLSLFGQNAIAVTNGGYIYYSNTGGETWSSTNIPNSGIFNTFNTCSLHGIVGGTTPENKGIVYASSPTSCFNKGTKILCLNKYFEEEYIAIELLKKGDLVKSYKHGWRKIDLIGTKFMINNPEFFDSCMYKMEKTENNGLLEDLIITGGHAILVDDLKEEKVKNDALFHGETPKIDDKYLLLSSVSNDFVKLENNDSYQYYHFVLENEGNDDERYGVWANGILTETPNKRFFLQQNFKM